MARTLWRVWERSRNLDGRSIGLSTPLKWDLDSPVTFKPDGHTVHDFDRRFQLEDDGFISAEDKLFRWSMLDEELNYRWF